LDANAGSKGERFAHPIILNESVLTRRRFNHNIGTESPHFEASLGKQFPEAVNGGSRQQVKRRAVKESALSHLLVGYSISLGQTFDIGPVLFKTRCPGPGS
jgi:hypothetical protein